MNTVEPEHHRFIEETILTVLLWVGCWGICSLLLDTYIHSFVGKLGTYGAITVLSFVLLIVRGHT
jgi:hypothetical protein